MRHKWLVFPLLFALLLTGCNRNFAVSKSDWEFSSSKPLTVDGPQPKSMVLIFDASDSMKPNIQQAQTSVAAYVRGLTPDVSVGLVFFNAGGVQKGLNITADHVAFEKAVDEIVSGGSTPLGEAVQLAYQMLLEQAKALHGQGEYHMAIVTDGQENFGSPLQESIQKILENSRIRICTIGFKISSGHVLNQKGPQIRYIPAENIKELEKGLQKILAEVE